MRRISFNLTQAQVLDRTKTVTRRLGWNNLRVGERLLGVDRLRSRDAKKLCVVEVVDVRRERLDAITCADVIAEGVWMRDCSTHHPEPTWPCVYCFIGRFCKAMKCEPETEVTRIEFKYVDEVSR